MTAKLATGVPEAGQIVHRLHSYIFRSQDFMPGGDGVNISSLGILLLRSIHKAGVTHIRVVLQNNSNLLQAKSRLFHQPLCRLQIATVHGSDG